MHFLGGPRCVIYVAAVRIGYDSIRIAGLRSGQLRFTFPGGPARNNAAGLAADKVGSFDSQSVWMGCGKTAVRERGDVIVIVLSTFTAYCWTAFTIRMLRRVFDSGDCRHRIMPKLLGANHLSHAAVIHGTIPGLS
jgi:hypothetical protein